MKILKIAFKKMVFEPSHFLDCKKKLKNWLEIYIFFFRYRVFEYRHWFLIVHYLTKKTWNFYLPRNFRVARLPAKNRDFLSSPAPRIYRNDIESGMWTIARATTFIATFVNQPCAVVVVLQGRPRLPNRFKKKSRFTAIKRVCRNAAKKTIEI